MDILTFNKCQASDLQTHQTSPLSPSPASVRQKKGRGISDARGSTSRSFQKLRYDLSHYVCLK